ncbi:YlxR family protein [Proteinivorax tanatarense]|uniref:YlxR family protein n=1 Tax=Proteinivorax tanatarense TaxID=1260629 RepID=A0AAU7VQM6_9FIRM
MRKRKVPKRMCIGCQEMKAKKEFIRVVKTQEEDIFIDPTGKQPGRGAYICPELECFKKAYKSKRLDKALKTAVPEDVYQILEDRLK